MTFLKNTIALTLVAATIAASGTVVQAAPQQLQLDLPILVDRYYEIKNPAGPVTAVEIPDELKGPQILYVVPEFDLEDMPNPQWEQQVIVRR